jgi:Zn-dependent metalloprotease
MAENKKKKKVWVVALALVLVVCIAGGAWWWISRTNTPVEEAAADPIADRAFGEYLSLSAGFTNDKITSPATAISAMNALKDILGFQNAADVLTSLHDNSIDDNTFYRMEQKYKGIPVYGRTMVAIADADGKAIGVCGNYLDVSDVDVTPQMDEATAQSKAADYLATELGADKSSISTESNGLTIYSLDEAHTLCYAVTCGDDLLLVNAVNGEIAYRTSEVAYASTVTAKGWDDKEYTLPTGKPGDADAEVYFDESRNISVYSYHGHDKDDKTAKSYVKDSENNTYAIDAYARVIKSYDFFKKVLKRTQFSGDATTPLSVYVEVDGGWGFTSNAGFSGWNTGGTITVYTGVPVIAPDHCGDLDVIAHEFAHGVTNTTANLKRDNQPGALYEAISDVFGELVEKYDTGKTDWQDGSRNMTEKKTSKDFSSNKTVHQNCLIIDYAAYLIGNGATDNATVGSLYTKESTRFLDPDQQDIAGITKMAKLWYGVQLMLMPNATFKECAVAATTMANFLRESNTITEAQAYGVRAAFDAIGYYNLSETALPSSNTQCLPVSRTVAMTGFALNALDAKANPLLLYNVKIYEGAAADPQREPVYSQENLNATATEPTYITLEPNIYTALVTDAYNGKTQAYTFSVADIGLQALTVFCLFERGTDPNAATTPDPGIVIPKWATTTQAQAKQATVPLQVDPTWIIQPQYDSVHAFSEGMAAVYMPNQGWGFINEQGKLTVPCQYDYVGDFSEGMAWVGRYSGSDTKYGYIDKTGKLVIQMQYDAAASFSEGLAAVMKGNKYSDGKIGFINKSGQVIIPFEYSQPVPGWFLDDDSRWHFSEGLAAVSKGRTSDTWGYGYIDKTGKTVIDFQYNAALKFSEGLARVEKTIFENPSYIDKTGKEVFSFSGHSIFTGGDFSEGLAAIENGDFGIVYVDKSGKTKIDNQLLSVSVQSSGYGRSFINGYAEARHGNNIYGQNHFGLIDKNGNFTSYISLFQRFPGYAQFADEQKLIIVFNNAPLIPAMKYERSEDTDSADGIMPVGKYGFVRNPLYTENS